ncbi:MAG: hypothetical protein VX546_00065 [Myxococcota bacterium]|nr:hypothetical protein [Myxococcota bacterium]
MRNERKAGEEMARELEKRGVPRAASMHVARSLLARCAGRDAGEVRAALDGAAAAWAIQHGEADDLERSARSVHEIQVLMQGFADEMRKLEEGLRVVSAYLTRMHDTARGQRSESHH